MTNIQDGKIKDLLPYSNLRIKAISYALNKQIIKLKLWSDTSRVKTMINTLQEQGLDLLAKEMNTPFYDITFDIEKKIKMIKNSFLYYSKMGTRYGVKLLLQDAFGGGEVYKEWYEYEGTHHHFYVSVASQMYTEEARQDFLKKLQKYSRLSVYCDGIVATNELPSSINKILSYIKIVKKMEVINV